jgi:hypothetical protein
MNILIAEERQLKEVRAAWAPLAAARLRLRPDLGDADRRLAIVVQMRALYSDLRAAKDQMGT